MYHYISKVSDNKNFFYRTTGLWFINGSSDFDPYRNEPRFKAILKANALIF